jgi:hypothetical protein
MTVSRTESGLLEEVARLASPDSLTFTAFWPSVEVCWRIEILVWIGMPGMSFSAIAFRIADCECQSYRLSNPAYHLFFKGQCHTTQVAGKQVTLTRFTRAIPSDQRVVNASLELQVAIN